ncbi:hypothetical protein KW794_00675 [Candidatus Saccharibacteria bacterium]|nr:hypothetical protein [Candidatus Saccharibacteria bacterium]
MAEKNNLSPVYRLRVDNLFDYFLQFRPNDSLSREEKVIDFIMERFTSKPEYSLQVLRGAKYKKAKLAGRLVLVEGKESGQSNVTWSHLN